MIQTNSLRIGASVALVFFFFSVTSWRVACGEDFVPGQKVAGDYETFASGFIKNHCVDCHGDDDPEAGLSLNELGPVNEVNAETWRSIWAQVAIKEMPPRDVEELEAIDRLKFSQWIVQELTRELQDKGGFKDPTDPSKANFVDHALLFGPLPDGIQLAPVSTPARLWRVTREEHITRLNELINTEPAYDQKNRGARTHGDAVPTNHGGELKMYFGTDRITYWQGGTVAYATAVKSVPAVFSKARDHGLKNYPDFFSVNSAEATQILDVADDIIRYMAYGPSSIAEPWQITDRPDSVGRNMQGDLRGLPSSILYDTKVVRPMTPVFDLMSDADVTEQNLRAAVDYLFEAMTYRPPEEAESDRYLEIVQQSIEKLGKEDGVVMGLSSIFLDRDALFRPELAEHGQPDQHGRIMLRDWELGLAVNHALSYIKPDELLREAIVEGRMRTADDVRREVKRMLEDDSIRKPRVLQFFRDYFDYDLGGYICKDEKALKQTGVSSNETEHYRAMHEATASTDRLIELILEEDHDVLRELLTTDRVVVTGSDSLYFGKRNSKQQTLNAIEADKKQRALSPEELLAVEEKRAQLLTAKEDAEKQVAELEAFVKANPEESNTKRKSLNQARRAVSNIEKSLKEKREPKRDHRVDKVKFSGPKVSARVSRRSFGKGSLKPERTLSTVPQGQRLGILTHPAWLVSHSDAMDNHAIRRGRWIQERLLGGGIPDVPITVDAMLPDEPRNTLRQRMRVTRETYCWTCHQKMDPLGLPFEMFNHAGLFRETELEQPVDTRGEIIDSGERSLDGKVKNAIEMIEKLAKSERAEQVFVRHAFRFWIGRNETLNDAPVLQAAHRAYRESGGSMKALIVSLLTSDAFLYRTRIEIE